MGHRRRSRSSKQGTWLLLLVLALVAWSLIAAYPWILVGAAALGCAAAYWRWWARPRRRAAAERERSDSAERAEAERRELERRDRRDRSLTLGGLLSLTAREFEGRVGEVLAEHGYSGIEHVGRAGDLGIDLFAIDPSGERFGIQCKRYAPDKLVRAPEVRLLYGDMAHARVRGMFVTTSGFTADAAAYGEAHGIVLIDGARLVKLVAATVRDAGVVEPSPG